MDPHHTQLPLGKLSSPPPRTWLHTVMFELVSLQPFAQTATLLSALLALPLS